MSEINLCVTEQIGHVCSFSDDKDIKFQRHCRYYDPGRLTSRCTHFAAGVMCRCQEAFPTARTVYYRKEDLPEADDSNTNWGESVIYEVKPKEVIKTFIPEIWSNEIFKELSKPHYESNAPGEWPQLRKERVIQNPRYIMHEDPRDDYMACVRRYCNSVGMDGKGDPGLERNVISAEGRLMKFASTPDGRNYFYDIHREMNYPESGRRPTVRHMEVQDGFFVQGQMVDTDAIREFKDEFNDGYYLDRNMVRRARIMRQFEERANPILEKIGEERKYEHVKKNPAPFAGDLLDGKLIDRMFRDKDVFKT